MRDLTEKQFNAALARHGIRREGFLGYCKITDDTAVSLWNVEGQSRRSKLAWLLKKQEHAKKTVEAE